MRALVIGGAGFLGARLVSRLAARGDVTVLDDRPSARLDPVRAGGRVELVRGDARILSDVDVVMVGHDVVFHLGVGAGGGDVDDSRIELEVGTIAAHNVLEAARRRGVRRLVLASSSAVYGDVDGAVDELGLGALPSTMRGANELASEALVAAFARTFGLSATVLRAGPFAGPESSDATLSALRERVATAGDTLLLGGAGARVAGFTHADDWADAAMFALEHAPGPLSVFNVAPLDVAREDALVAAFVARARPGLAIRFDAAAPPLPWPRVELSGARLAALGWTPARGSLDAVSESVSFER